MDRDLHDALTGLETRLRAVEVGNGSFNAPAWRDVDALNTKLQATQAELTALRVKHAESVITRGDVQKMIDAAVYASKASEREAQVKLFNRDDFQDMITERAVDLLRSEMKISVGAAADAATASKSVVRSNIDASIASLRAASHYFARG